MVAFPSTVSSDGVRYLGLLYAWTGVAVMLAFWVSFAVFLAAPRQLADDWPLPTVDYGGSIETSWAAAVVDVALVTLFGLQHSLMARPWFKRGVTGRMPEAFQRCTYVHMANLALFALIAFWQPIPVELWRIASGGDLAWVLFALGWIVLFLGAWSFGMGELLGLAQMHRWARGLPPERHRLKTGGMYRWLRHPMYLGVLTVLWATPRMTVGHALLALGLTGYVLIAMRYEERDLRLRFGAGYAQWREAGR